MLSYVTAAKATGYSVIVMTIMSNAVLPDGPRATLNGLITGGAAGNGYIVADVGANATMGCNGCNSNMTYFQPDGTHPTVAGHIIVAGIVKTALQSLGF